MFKIELTAPTLQSKNIKCAFMRWTIVSIKIAFLIEVVIKMEKLSFCNCVAFVHLFNSTRVESIKLGVT